MISENASSATSDQSIVIPSVPFRPYYQDALVTIYNADCRQVLPFLPRFDLLLTDPPYGLGKKLTGGQGEWGTHFEKSPEWDHVLSPDLLVRQCVSIADKAIVWGGNYYELPPTRCWLSWDKMQEHTSGHFEMAWTNLDKPTRTFRMSRVEAHSNGKRHPTEKPVELMKYCIELISSPGDTIFDPFMGSGTTGVAAVQTGRNFIGCELDPDYFAIAERRIKNAQPPLFVDVPTRDSQPVQASF